MKKTSGNMYDFVTHTWNPVRGKCPYDCVYCYVGRWKRKQEILDINLNELKTDLGTNNVIFICSGCDLFHQDVPDDWIFHIYNQTISIPLHHDKFATEEHTRYRVLYIGEDGYYQQDVYDERIGLDYPVETFEPMMHGERLSEIPFFTVPGIIPEKSMLYDLAQLNIQHYQDTADYQNGKHYTSIPTPIAIGLKPAYDETGNPKPMFIGGTQFQFFPNEDHTPSADVKFLEPV